jgi:RNA-directed DNA polymerase
VANEANLRRAFERVASNDGAPGPDRQSVDEVRVPLDAALSTLHRTLLDGSYRPGLIRRVWIPKTGGGQRGLGIPNVADRIVQQAVHQVLSPHYEPTFHPSSHGFRTGRSCHTAIAEARQHLEEGYGWLVDLDLEAFFDRVPTTLCSPGLSCGSRTDGSSPLPSARTSLPIRTVPPRSTRAVIPPWPRTA